MFTRKGVVRSLSVFLAVGMFCFFAVPKGRAEGFGGHQEMFVTVNHPVQIPGRVIGPGTYIFRVLRPTDNLNTVQIINARTLRTDGLFLTLPTSRAKANGKGVVKLQEASSGNAIPSVTKWFYPDTQTGHKFIYTPAEKEMMSSLAQKTHTAKG